MADEHKERVEQTAIAAILEFNAAISALGLTPSMPLLLRCGKKARQSVRGRSEPGEGKAGRERNREGLA